MQDAESLREQLDRLETGLAQVGQSARGFEGDLSRMQESLVFTGREVTQLAGGIGGGLRRAFDGLVFDGAKLSDVMRGLGQSIANTAYNTAMRPVQQAAGQAVAGGLNALISGIMPFANGGAFSQGRVMPFAEGGVVSGPVTFPMRGGTGLMGEAGPEAILPLARGADGRLGVRSASAASARPVQVVMNISTPDSHSFQRSQSQIAARMGRLLAQGQRNS